MAENSSIEWCHHTFNPWIGCTKVSPACDNCYAEDWDKRYNGGEHWGPKAPRRRTSEANWRKPLKWNKEAEKNGVRYRVFCASLADVFDNKVDPEWRRDLWELIKATPNLDWLLLTKRPQNIMRFLPDDYGVDKYPNVWLGTTVENQDEASRRIPHLLDIPAAVRFLSMEPLLGEVDLSQVLPKIGGGEERLDYISALDEGIDWVITGGESGSHFRSADPDWFRSLRDQCAARETAFLFKQWDGARQKDIKLKGRELDGKVWNQYPEVRSC